MIVALLIAALVCFLIAALAGLADGGSWTRVGFGWLGLALLTIAQLIPALS